MQCNSLEEMILKFLVAVYFFIQKMYLYVPIKHEKYLYS